MLQVNVARLHDDNREALSLAWIAGREGGTAVRREAAKAASLIGHLNLTHPNSIQVVGAYEAGTLAGFVERLFEFAPAAVIIADGVAPPPQLLDAAARTHTPLFTSPMPAARVIDKLARYLAKALAESTERHGVFMDVLGLGVLITGETAVRPKMKLKLIVHLEKPRPEGRDPGERLPLADLWEDILGVTVRKVIIPVAAGRNLAVLVEAAVRNHILKLRGVDSTAEFLARQKRGLDGSESEGEK